MGQPDEREHDLGVLFVQPFGDVQRLVGEPKNLAQLARIPHWAKPRRPIDPFQILHSNLSSLPQTESGREAGYIALR